MDKINVFLSEEQIRQRVAELGKQITEDYRGRNKKLLLVGILKGSVIFMSDIMRQIDLDLEIDFMVVSSYEGGIKSTGNVKIVKDLGTDIEDMDVLMIEDIYDTGYTLDKVIKMLKERNPASVKVCSLLEKPDKHVTDLKLDYVGFTVPDKFVLGCGLDYEQKYRNLPYIGILEKE